MKRVLLIGAVVMAVIGLSEAQDVHLDRPSVPYQAALPPVMPNGDAPAVIEPEPQDGEGTIEIVPRTDDDDD